MKRNGIGLLSAVIALMCSAPPTAAQQNDETAVRDVVKRLFDGMRTRDTAMIKSVFHAEARMYGQAQDGSIELTTPARFAQIIAGAPPNLVLDEVLHETEVRIDGNLATFWAYYDFFAGDNFSHCGYDAFQLLKSANTWKIVALADSRRREGCKQKRVTAVPLNAPSTSTSSP